MSSSFAKNFLLAQSSEQRRRALQMLNTTNTLVPQMQYLQQKIDSSDPTGTAVEIKGTNFAGAAASSGGTSDKKTSNVNVIPTITLGVGPTIDKILLLQAGGKFPENEIVAELTPFYISDTNKLYTIIIESGLLRKLNLFKTPLGKKIAAEINALRQSRILLEDSDIVSMDVA